MILLPSLYLPLAGANACQEGHQGPDQAALDLQRGEEMVTVDIELTRILARAGCQGAEVCYFGQNSEDLVNFC